MAFIADYILDLLLAEFANANNLYICSQEPVNFTGATSTYKLGTKTAISIGAPADRTPTGRKVTVASFSNGTVDASGTATHWALTKTTGSVLMATGALASSQAVTSGNSFSLAAFDIGVPDAA